MELTAYERYRREEMILRDELAMDRTRLANERTFLAYGRTAIMLVITGGTLLKLFGHTALNEFAAWTIIVVGVATAILGLSRYLRTRQQLGQLAIKASEDQLLDEETS